MPLSSLQSQDEFISNEKVKVFRHGIRFVCVIGLTRETINQPFAILQSVLLLIVVVSALATRDASKKPLPGGEG